MDFIRVMLVCLLSLASFAQQAPCGAPTKTPQVCLSWNAVTGTGITYNVFWGTSSGGEGATPINPKPLATTYYLLPGTMTAGVHYYYHVTALSGTAQSAPSLEASATCAQLTGGSSAEASCSTTQVVGGLTVAALDAARDADASPPAPTKHLAKKPSPQ
jgi:hypothetical protein